MCLNCWRKLELFHLFSEEVKLAQAKYVEELKFANPFPDRVQDDVMHIDDENEIDEPTSTNVAQMDAIEPAVHQPTNAPIQQQQTRRPQAIDEDSSDNDAVDEQNLEKSMGLPAPWFSGLSESLRNEMVRKYFDMSCEMCPNVLFQSDTEARLHYLKQHRKMGYIRCCGKRYFDKINVYNHIEYHKHPENFK